MIDNKDLIVETVCLNPDEYISILKKHAIRVTHKPSGLVAQCGTNRSQHKNRTICLEMLEMGLSYD